jgi:chemotaxis protein histidine kinase CheA
MRQRITSLGGEFKIGGSPTGGTTIEISVPLSEAVASDDLGRDKAGAAGLVP